MPLKPTDVHVDRLIETAVSGEVRKRSLLPPAAAPDRREPTATHHSENSVGFPAR
jgi:hypothetical protein